MPTPEEESSDDDLLARLGPKALLARGLEETASPPPSPTPPPTPAGPGASARDQNLEAATLAEMFPEFRFEGVISRGGFGTVYRAEHRQMKRRVAVKILSSAVTRNVSAVARFEREIAAIGTLDHPGIVRAFDAGQRGGVWFLAMELVEGADLSTLSRALGPLPPAEACELIRQAALAIQHAHERHLIHRDVKPSNMMLATEPDGAARVKVLDFGLAQLGHNENTGGELTISGELLGTVDYIAPEQISNPRTVDARADVYGLGATLYRLLAGQAPHQTTDATSSLYAKLIRIAHEACPGIATLRPDLAPALAAVVDRMVARDPDQRFATARDAADALAPFAEFSALPALLARVPRLELQESQEHLEPLPRPLRRKKFIPLVVSLFSLAALAVVIAVALLNAEKSQPPRANANTNLPALGGFEPGQVPGAWLQADLKASQPKEGDHFGHSVAVSGDTVVVGVPGVDTSSTGVNSTPDENAANSGAVYVFVRSGSIWTQQACLKASNTAANDQFGISVAISGDTVIVGAAKEDSKAAGVNGNQADNSAFNSGAAYVFTRSGTNWTQQAYLKASNTGTDDQFGFSVAVSGDTVVVGAYLENADRTGVNSTPGDSGAAYVFTRRGSTWTQQAYLKSSNAEGGDLFGWSVAVSGDTVVVGASLEDSNATGVDGDQADNSASYSGAAYVFVRSGSTWSQQAYLKASHPVTVVHDQFGHSVAVSGDTVVVGAMNEDNYATGVNGNQANQNGDKNYGAAYVFVRSGSTWSQQAYLKASNPGEGDQFGYSVALSGDTVVVGAVNEASKATGVNGEQADESAIKSGAAYLFERRGSTWSQRAYLKASHTRKYDRFGRWVAVSGDTVVVGVSKLPGTTAGVNRASDESASIPGAAYIFKVGDRADGER